MRKDSYRAKSIVHMYLVENLSGPQIADELGISLSQVRNILARNCIKKSKDQIHNVRLKNHHYETEDHENFTREDGKHFKKMSRDELYDKMTHKY